MKIRKNVVAWIGIILCVVVAGIIFATPASNLFALLCAALFVPFVITLNKAEAKKEEDGEEPQKKKINWPLTIGWSLVVLAALTTILFAVFLGWLFLIPLAICCGALMWLAELLDWPAFWSWVFIFAIIIAIILLGVYGIVGSNNSTGNYGHVSDLYVDNLYVQDATVDNMDVENETVENQDVEDQTVTNATVENQDVENQTVTNQTVENQVVENQTVTNQTVENQTVTNPTEPEATEPPETEPQPTDPPHTHSYNSVVTEPTCMTQGFTTHTCDCGDSYKDSYKGALGHSYKSTVVEPTTEAGGYTEHKCERCGHTYKDDFTDKLPKPTEPEVVPAIKCASTIRYGETLYVNLEGINASNLKVSNKIFVAVEVLSDSRVTITLTEDVTGYLTITDTVSGTNVVIDIVEG